MDWTLDIMDLVRGAVPKNLHSQRTCPLWGGGRNTKQGLLFLGFKPISNLVLTQGNASYISVYSVKYRIQLRCSYNTTYSLYTCLPAYTCPRTIRTRGQVLLLSRVVAGMQEDINWVESEGFTRVSGKTCCNLFQLFLEIMKFLLSIFPSQPITFFLFKDHPFQSFLHSRHIYFYT